MELDREADNLTPQAAFPRHVAQETVTRQVSDARPPGKGNRRIRTREPASEFYRDLYPNPRPDGLGWSRQQQQAAGIAGRQMSPLGNVGWHFRKRIHPAVAETATAGISSHRGWPRHRAGVAVPVSTATDAASQMENLFTNAFQTIGNVGGSAALNRSSMRAFCGGQFFRQPDPPACRTVANAATNQLIGGISAC